MTRLAVAAILALAFALSAVSFASAQGGPDVQIAQLQCSGDPELVVIENLGDADQEFTGWELQSDPPDSEIFDLSQFSSLAGGASLTIQSGPSASSLIADPRWQTGEFIFRDDDPTDYARIVDNTGAVVHQVNCAVGATPTPSPSPSPMPSPVNGVPNGGGPPAPTGGALSSTMMVLIGGSMAAVGVATLALPRLRLLPSAAPRSPVQRLGRDDSGRRPSSATFGLAVAALAAVIFLLLRRRRA